MVERQVPGPAAENPERIQSRPYPDFARFPDEELSQGEDERTPPDAMVAGRVNVAAVLVVVGFAVAFLTFVLRNPIPLVAGLALMLLGALWSAVRARSGRGTGPVTIRESR